MNHPRRAVNVQASGQWGPDDVAERRHDVAKRVRALLLCHMRRRIHAVYHEPWHAADVPFGLSYPAHRPDGMFYPGHQYEIGEPVRIEPDSLPVFISPRLVVIVVILLVRFI